MRSQDRSRLGFKLAYATRHPGRILPYARRRLRDARLLIRTSDHVSYYREIMRSNTTRGAEAAVGSPTRDAWMAAGQMQFDYLLRHGLRPGMRMLEIGCGNLRAGRLFIDYLDAGGYHGIDISPEILLAALNTIAEFDLQDRRPALTLVGDLKLSFLPDAAFDVVHSHSVFSHSPVEVIEECLENVGRVLAPGGFFDFTAHLTDGSAHQVLREDFYYRLDQLTALAAKHGLEVRLMEDWNGLHRQSKLRTTVRASQMMAV